MDIKKKVMVIGVCIITILLFIGIFLLVNLNDYNTIDKKIEEKSYWEIDAVGIGIYIVDGDTLDVSGLERIRLADINTPESGKNGYQEAKDYLISLTLDKTVYVDIDDLGSTSYGRIIAMIFVRHNSTHLLNINKAIIMNGFGIIWDFTNNEFDPNEWTLYVEEI